MNTEEYRKKTNDELKQELNNLVKERFNLRIQRGSGLNPKPHLFSINKKNIARIKTILNEKKQMENKKVKTILAKVLSNKMDKSATVIVERQIKHPVNGKFIKRTSKYHIHDENNECEVGQQVKIQQCRPISKTKFWSLFKEDQ